MTILIYDHFELEERASKHLKVWKVWHIILYTAAAIFGLLNFVFLQSTMQLVHHNCILFPRKLEFRWVDMPDYNNAQIDNAHNTSYVQSVQIVTAENAHDVLNDDAHTNETAQDKATGETAPTDAKKVKREVDDDDNDNSLRIMHDDNGTAITGNTTHRLILDTARTLFENDSTCQFAEFMPLLSAIFAAVWITFFTMCPGGGHPRTGLQQPWQIITPALLFAIVMVGLTGHSFNVTNKGLHAFCAAFSEVTNSTNCFSVEPFLELGLNATMGLGHREASTRGASAAVLAAWVVAAALLFARCLAAPDFVVKRTGAYVKDPSRKLTPHLRKSLSKHSQRSSTGSPNKRDTISVRSDPTVTTELVSASVEPGDSAPTSLMATPAKRRNSDIEMAYESQEIAETAIY